MMRVCLHISPLTHLFLSIIALKGIKKYSQREVLIFSVFRGFHFSNPLLLPTKGADTSGVSGASLMHHPCVVLSLTNNWPAAWDHCVFTVSAGQTEHLNKGLKKKNEVKNFRG